jgi:hypothetical protein
LRVAKIVQIGVLQLEEMIVDARQSAEANKGALEIEDNLLSYQLV